MSAARSERKVLKASTVAMGPGRSRAVRRRQNRPTGPATAGARVTVGASSMSRMVAYTRTRRCKLPAMSAQGIWWPYWYFHFPNYALALLFWTLIGRFLFELFLPPDSPNYIFRWFRRLTAWLIRPVAFITPAIVPRLALSPIAAFWIAIARVVFFAVLYASGLAPRVPGN